MMMKSNTFMSLIGVRRDGKKKILKNYRHHPKMSLVEAKAAILDVGFWKGVNDSAR